MKKKYDWVNLKMAYFIGEEDQLEAFLVSNDIPLNGGTRSATAGWYSERQKFHREAGRVALEGLQKTKADLLQRGMENLINFGFLEPLSTRDNIQKIQFIDRVRIWEVLMSLMGKPTKVTKQVNSFDNNIYQDITPEHEDIS